MTPPRLLLVAATALVMAAAPPPPAGAQNLFAPVARVGEGAVTGFELDQRARLLALLGTGGDLEALALEQLIEDRLRLLAATRAGIALTEEQQVSGEAEFASRGDLSRERFIELLEADGVAYETFRDFVRAGILWREVVRQRFGGALEGIGEDEVSRAIAEGDREDAILIELSEIILRADTPAFAAEAERLADEIEGIETFAAFEAAARSLSLAASAAQGGRVPALPATRLPPPIRSALLTLSPGEVAGPFPLGDQAIALFQLRDVRETVSPEPEGGAVDYAVLALPGGRTEAALAEAARVRALALTCNDLYPVARQVAGAAISRQTVPLGAVPDAIRARLALLDAGEMSADLTGADGALLLLMLCERTALEGAEGAAAAEGDALREEVLLRLRNERLGALADGYLAELRADVPVVVLP